MANILVVDDEPQVLVALGRILQSAGHDARYAGDAAQAREVLAEGGVELMLCDINMPGGSGLELTREVLKEGSDVAIVMSTAIQDPEVAARALEYGAYGYLMKPSGSAEVQIAVTNALRRRELELQHKAYQQLLEQVVLKRTRELDLSREETIQRLARAAEFRDNETAEHNQRMSHYCKLMARRLGMSEVRCEQIRLASVMHDVGKIGIPDQILFKPDGLTDEEFTRIKTHSDLGRRILMGSNTPLLELAATIAHTHHEKFNGLGYPRGLRGKAIPIEGRIAAVADVFDALTSDRVYRRAWTVDRTVDLLERESCSHFDPELVDLFLQDIDEVLEIKRRHADRLLEPRAGGPSNEEIGMSTLDRAMQAMTAAWGGEPPCKPTGHPG